MSYRKSAATLSPFRGVSRRRKNVVGTKFGDLELVKLGYSQDNWFRCSQGHEQLMNVNQMRRREKKGEPPMECPGCKKAEAAE